MTVMDLNGGLSRTDVPSHVEQALLVAPKLGSKNPRESGAFHLFNPAMRPSRTGSLI
jgi:hypothetical protein